MSMGLIAGFWCDFSFISKKVVLFFNLCHSKAQNGQIYEAIIYATAKNGCFSLFFRMAIINDIENDS